MSCADVCLEFEYEGSGAAFYTERVVTARKVHRCCECFTAIPVGATYQRASGKYDGEVSTVKTCAACMEIRKAFVCGAWIFGQLWEEIEQVMFPILYESGPLDCLAKLKTVEARQKCRDRYHEWQQETR